MVTTQDWLDAQVGVIGSVLICPDLAAKVLSETTEADFSGQCLSIYRAIRKLFREGKPADPVMVRSELGEAYTKTILDICEVTPTSASVDYYIDACRKRSQLLQLRDLGQQLQNADNLEDAMSLLEKANRRAIERTGVEIVTMEQAMTQFYQRKETKKRYLSWPIEGLNDKLFVDKGDLVVLAGYPSDGKTALAIQLAYHMAQTNRVGFFSLETNPDKIHDRLMAHVSHVPFGNIKVGDLAEMYWERVAKSSESILSHNLEYIPAAGKTITEIQAITLARRYDIIFVDYLQLVSGKGRDRYSMVTEISIGLHTMAQARGVTVVALSQLNRPEKVRMGGGKKSDGNDRLITPAPQLSNLRESGQIEQDADVVLMLYRPMEDKPQRSLLIRKNKEGELGSIILDFDGQYQTFTRNKGEKYNQLQKDIRKAASKPQQEYEQLPMDTYVPF